MLRFGYASQNLTIPAGTGHTLRLTGLGQAEKVRSLVERNLDDLEAILRWNAAHGICLFRISQQLVPFASHPLFPYDWQAVHGSRIQALGARAAELGMLLSLHPGQFIQPGSPTPRVAAASLAELRYVARLLTLLEPAAGVMVLHLGGAQEGKPAAVERFVAALEDEGEILRYLAVEADERSWSVPEVVPVAERLDVPAIVDTLHHAHNSAGLSLRQALGLALPTWGDRRPKVHLSSQDPTKRPGAHAELVSSADFRALLDALPTDEVDVMVEAKGKERAVLGLLPLAGVWGRVSA